MISNAARLRSTLLWSVLAAAFIGPGTVTTAASAGAGFGLGLLWALVFSIIATVLLQEAAARLTLVSGRSLGEIIAHRRGGRGQGLRLLLFGAIVLGCAAYEAGNLLGALSGLRIFSALDRTWLLLLGLVSAALLWYGDTRAISRVLAGVVALMGLTFIWVAFGADTALVDWLSGLLPRVDDDSALLVIGLVGTTIVPYNLFLATGLSRGQDLSEMRWGLTASILIGGVITLAILVAGTLTPAGTFSFQALAEAVGTRTGAAGPLLFGIGLAAAGLSSAITAPLAAAITGQTLFGDRHDAWQSRGRYFRLTWLGVLAVGTGFGLLDVQPIPVIIAAQAVNGFILPLVAIFLLRAVNDRSLLPPEAVNGKLLNALTLVVVAVAILLGLHNVWLAAGRVFPVVLTVVALPVRVLINALLAVLVLIPTVRQLYRSAGAV